MCTFTSSTSQADQVSSAQWWHVAGRSLHGPVPVTIPSRVSGDGIWAAASVQWDFYVSSGSRKAAILGLWLSQSIALGRETQRRKAESRRKEEGRMANFRWGRRKFMALPENPGKLKIIGTKFLTNLSDGSEVRDLGDPGYPMRKSKPRTSTVISSVN